MDKFFRANLQQKQPRAFTWSAYAKLLAISSLLLLAAWTLLNTEQPWLLASGLLLYAATMIGIACHHHNPTTDGQNIINNAINIIGAIPDLLCKIAPNGEVLWHNQAFADLLGVLPTDGAVLNLHQLFTAPESEHLQNSLDRAALIGKTCYDTNIMRGSKALPFNLCLIAQTDSRQQVNSFVCIGRNISEHVAAEKERRELMLKLQQAQKMESIGHLTGGIAHDFNNILTSIIGYSQLATQKGESHGDAKLIHYLQQINDAGARAKELISQLLSFSRKQARELSAVNANALIEEIMEMLRPVIPSSINIQFDVPAPPLFINTDPVQFHQLIMNLCINARDAMESQGTLTIKLAQVRHQGGYCQACYTPFGGDYAELSITDTGHGISAELMEQIFQPFTSTKEVGKGTGMGLAIVHGIVHDHNGHIAVQSQPGVGTTFSLYLPLAESNAALPELQYKRAG